MKKYLLFCLLTVLLFSFQTPVSIKNKLIGSWEFVSFIFPNYISPDSKEAKEANTANKGLTITFTEENKFISVQKTGLTQNNTTTTYKVSSDAKHISIGSETSLID